MSKIIEYIGLTGFSETIQVAIRELFPNFGKKQLSMVFVYGDKSPHMNRNKKW